ncbi:10555_t:CDS:2, partial [Ambispora gerdemannii]
GMHGKAPANIVDEAIDEVLIAREECESARFINTISIISISKRIATNDDNSRAEFFEIHVEPFYVTYPQSVDACRISSQARYHSGCFVASSFEKRHNNKWPVLHEIMSDGKFTYTRQTNEWEFSWVYETQKQLRKTQADSSVRKNRRVRYWTNCSPVQVYGRSLSTKDKLAASTSKRKKRKAWRLEKVVSYLRRKILRLQSEIHRKAIAFFVHEFDNLIVRGI